ncbi:MAG: glycoside hydrolase family 65 protein [Dehalococcoidia bacterium]|nr:glycoside hydrolase family 65 protein [Dehalococcoidia bacterium]
MPDFQPRHPAADPRDEMFEGIPDFGSVWAEASDRTWFLREDDYEPALEHDLESRFSVGNGFLGIRGSLDLPTEASRPRTYVAGLFGLRPGPPALSALTPAPQAFGLRFSFDGEELNIGRGVVKEHSRLLDYCSGVLRSIWRHQLPSGRIVSLESLRFAALAKPELAVQLLRLQMDAPSGVGIFVYEVNSSILIPLTDASPVWQTSDGTTLVSCMRLVRLQVDTAPPSSWIEPPGLPESLRCAHELSILQLTSYGIGDEPPAAMEQARTALRNGRLSGLQGLYESHSRHWRERWQNSDVVIKGDEQAQEALRFAVYHLNSSVRPGDPTVSVAARGLTGDGYLGHVFWDTDLFMLPFYTFTWPAATRSLLEYRFRTLPAALAKAHKLGFRGALYAWESTDTGEEATPPYAIGPHGEVIAIRNGDLEQHISAAVAYGAWQYWQATRDIPFFLNAGAEMLLETARFWASRAQREKDGLYHIRGVIGPDEYHEDIDDNAYTNYMARWNIERGLDAARLLSRRWPGRWQELLAKLALSKEELDDWRTVAGSIYLPLDPTSGLIEQFSGYFGLEDIDMASYEARTAPMDVLLGPERTRRSQVIKQADVIMLLALLPDASSPELSEKNFEYYEARCGHGSSLSPPIHSLVAARLGRLDLAGRYFHQTAAIDLSDSMGNSAAGLHMGALGGLWQATVFGFGGLTVGERGLAFAPHLPAGWRRLRFPLRWRGRQLAVDISNEPCQVEISLLQGLPMSVHVGNSWQQLRKGQPLTASFRCREEGT